MSINEIDITYEFIENIMIEKLAGSLDIHIDEVDVDKPINDFGLDSLAMLSLGEMLGRVLGRKMEPTLLWYYPTIAGLSQHLVDEFNITHSKTSIDS